MSDETETAKPAPKTASSGAGAKSKDAKGAKGAKGKGEGKDASKGKAKGGSKKGKSGPPGSLAKHPRAARAIRRSKAWGGLAGFLIAGYLSLNASVPFDQAGLRALLAGIAGYMLGWGCAVVIWRQILLAELRALAELMNPKQPDAPADGNAGGSGG